MQPVDKHRYRNAEEFVKATRKAIELERKEETEQFQQTIEENPTKELEAMGLAIANLRVKSIKTGLYGRRLVTLARPAYSKAAVQSQKNLDKIKLPDSRFGVGDNVGIYDQSEYVRGKPLLEGVVHNKLEFKMTISFDDSEDVNEQTLENRMLCVCAVTNEVTYNRYSKVLDEMQKACEDQEHPSLRIIRCLFDYRKSEPIVSDQQVEFADPGLNLEQKEAVLSSLRSQSVHLIHGPPGTGKTKTVCELIVQAARKGWKVLACAGSNVAVDNIVERIHRAEGVRPCRIGHPSRMLQSVYDCCLDSLVLKTSSQKLMKEQKHHYDQVKAKYIKTNERQARRQLKDEMIQARNEIRVQEEVAIKEVLDESNVICCTNTGAADRVFKRQLAKAVFDLVVIDQCAQSVEVSCWMPILKGRRLVLAGDHKQLPPTIKCKQSQDLAYTLFDRAMKECPVTSTLLSTQYRMNEAIMQWSSRQFYEGKLVAHESVKSHNINGCVKQLEEVKAPLMFIDTAGSKMGQNLDRDSNDTSRSKYNVGQADLVKLVYFELKAHGLLPSQIGIITPYNAQVNLIKQLLEGEGTQIATVDGFQGREKECIIISMVRSNPKKVVGFLADQRRMNVAVTRARRFVCLIGDSETVSSDPVLKTLVDYFNEHAEHRTANDFSGDPSVRFGLGYIEHSQSNSAKPTKQPKPKKQKKSSKRQEDGIKQIDDSQLDRLASQAKENLEKEQNRPHFPSLIEQRKLEEKFESLITGFMSSQDNELSLHGLPGNERRIVHIVAERFDLLHETSYDKKTLTLRKAPQQIEVQHEQRKIQQQLEKAREQRKEGELEKKKQEEMELFVTQKRQQLREFLKTMNNTFSYRGLNGDERNVIKSLAKELGLLFEVSTNKKIIYVYRNQEKFEEERAQKANAQRPTGKNKPAQKKDDKNEPINDEEETLEYLKKEIEDAKRCHYPISECKANVLVLGQHCKYCRKMFCSKHILAEEHGCDEPAKADARQRFKRQIEKTTRDDPKSNPMMQYKLQDRIKQMQQDRKPKKPGKR